jgi:hypothetical protein
MPLDVQRSIQREKGVGVMLSFHRLTDFWTVLPLAAALGVSAQSQTPSTHTAPMSERFGKPYVEVTIEGKGPFRFIIDTGTGADAFVTPALVERLNLPPAGEVLLNDPSHEGAQRVPTVLIPHLQLAGVDFYWIEAVVHPVTEEAGDCQGLLGFTLFHDYLLTLDFPRRQVEIEEGELKPDGERDVLPMRMPDGIPITTLRVSNQPVEAALDSGGGGLTLSESLASHLKWDVDPVVFATGQSLTTSFSIKTAKLASDVTLGRYTFTHPVVEINPAFRLVNFGSPPMQNFAITFDQKNLLVRLQASSDHMLLVAPPTPSRLTNQPQSQPAPPHLVPIG